MVTAKPTGPILVVDDEEGILTLEQSLLEREGYQVVTARGGEEALRLFAATSPSLVLLDVRMPGMDGFTACERLRQVSQVPLIIVTARGTNDDKVRGLELGADDYVTKPFSPKELIARVKAALRRANLHPDSNQPAFTIGDLTVDLASNRVTLRGEEVLLSPTEYRLLLYLVRNAGRVLTPDQILERVWGQEYVGDHHLLRVTIGRLRQKLGDVPRPRYITTRRGLGYRFATHVQ